MPIAIPRSLVEFILLGPEDDRRQLQDSPILGDVWVEFATHPGDPLELLITPYREQAAGAVASQLAEYGQSQDGIRDADVAYLQGIIAARLSFEEVLRFVVPMTQWWKDRRMKEAVERYAAVDGLEAMVKDIRNLLEAAGDWQAKRSRTAMQDVEARKRYIALAGLILWAEDQPGDPQWERLPSKDQIQRILETTALESLVAGRLASVFEARIETDGEALVWTVSLNRRATPALTRSVPAVKADAARTLFRVDCSEIVWAVIDSGIEASHPAFRGPKGQSRIRRSFDFTRIREIVSLDNSFNEEKRRARIKGLIERGLKSPLSEEEAQDHLRKLAIGARENRSINWELVAPLVEIDSRTPPPSNHGTHVAGIIGAGKPEGQGADFADGMCPDIHLYDFRVLAPTLRETEFAIIAALQYIRYINERNSYMTVHGANLSLSIPHDVRNYACGRTPVCNECERLVNSGVVVVAAAGNRGYQNFETKDGLYEGYAAFSITDPGNADGVVTVGATHRYWPHTYGVSFFSSRGPTGDGRLKPDLVAPGERIRAPLLNEEWGDLDGTSMAAPHVSGAAAMLMARYSELVGQPRRIKSILCDSATDLGRERSFQGHGMLDVLRAFQSV
jgi:serine protease AprX